MLDSAAAVRSHRDTAIDLASGFLAQLRDRGWPPPEPGAETDERTLADSATFLQKIFPEDIAAVRGHAAALVSVRRIAGLRRDRGLSAAALARRSGLSLGQITKIELGGLRDATVADAAAYISGLGGRLRLAADLGAGEQAEISG